jgi:hypothetical protein
LRESLKTKWENNIMHGQYIRSLDRQLINEEDMFLWLLKGDLKAGTESEIVAAQDQALQTKYYATKIFNTETDSKCRLCQQFDETIEHIISACPILAKEQYIKRHDRVCARKRVKLDKKHVPESIETIQGGYCGINKCRQTEPSPTTNPTS